MSTTAEADFDAFYASHWRPLLLQTLAISGDLGSAHGATQHAFADLWEHWPHARGEDPVDFGAGTVLAGVFAKLDHDATVGCRTALENRKMWRQLEIDC